MISEKNDSLPAFKVNRNTDYACIVFVTVERLNNPSVTVAP